MYCQKLPLYWRSIHIFSISVSGYLSLLWYLAFSFSLYHHLKGISSKFNILVHKISLAISKSPLLPLSDEVSQFLVKFLNHVWDILNLFNFFLNMLLKLIPHALELTATCYFNLVLSEIRIQVFSWESNCHFYCAASYREEIKIKIGRLKLPTLFNIC